MRGACFVPLIIWLALLAVARGERVNVPVLRSVPGGGPTADMKSRLANWSILGGRGSVGHYCAHGLHAQVRNQHGGTNNVNAIYLGGGVAYVFPEPRGIRLSEVLRGPIRPLRADSSAVRYWENEPLYLLDELGAYFWGTSVGLYARDRSGQTTSSYRFARQKLTQCRYLVTLCRQRGYSHTDELNGVVESAAKSMDKMGRMLGER